MKMEKIKEFAGIFGAIEAFITFIFALGIACMADYQVPALAMFTAILIMASGVLLFITCWEG